MIDINKLLKGKHITVRYLGIFSFHNLCDYKFLCNDESCKNCECTSYCIRIKNGNKYRLPNLIQKILRKIWN